MMEIFLSSAKVNVTAKLRCPPLMWPMLYANTKMVMPKVRAMLNVMAPYIITYIHTQAPHKTSQSERQEQTAPAQSELPSG